MLLVVREGRKEGEREINMLLVVGGREGGKEGWRETNMLLAVRGREGGRGGRLTCSLQ